MNQAYGYVRVSSIEQNEDRQMSNSTFYRKLHEMDLI